jgi:curved DNA-binding protein CbpA
VLDVPPTASPDEIRRTYRRRVRAYHPDTRTASQALASADDNQLQLLIAAYDILRDPERRARYDRAAARRNRVVRRSSAHDPGETTSSTSAVTVRILGVTLDLDGVTIRRPPE